MTNEEIRDQVARLGGKFEWRDFLTATGQPIPDHFDFRNEPPDSWGVNFVIAWNDDGNTTLQRGLEDAFKTACGEDDFENWHIEEIAAEYHPDNQENPGVPVSEHRPVPLDADDLLF